MTLTKPLVNGTRPRVLLVDDTAGVRKLLRIALELAGDFDVLVDEASDGRQAVELADMWQPDLLLLDMAMPVMDGLQALPLIRQCSPETAVVVLSAFSADRLEHEALALGATAYIEKGLAIAELVDRLLEIAHATSNGTDH